MTNRRVLHVSGSFQGSNFHLAIGALRYDVARVLLQESILCPCVDRVGELCLPVD